ncbi:MAG: bifunctional phosphopantothenoylcysteine decarboxylase/phosphopantothenate--cysteine ligase CoaBC [Leptolyngbyaceae cyanobacterium MO_188.B28]|nr:bifunctional phosphopantothenoylcysteine decarboxylase/phosphopantothenate--cysteine ligase CoaBC [Leptolyngbyaceae cyanobacterium MO_188.B28]
MAKQPSRILLGVGGGIAAYKICEVASTLAKEGFHVKAVLTDAAQEFVTPLTFSTLCRHPAYTDESFWQPVYTRPLHIELGEWADVFLIAPLTANTLGKLTHGLADNLLTNIVLASQCPILLAPAMNTDMWRQVSVQQNWRRISEDPRYHTVGPGSGLLACDRVGPGRMAEPKEILAHLQSLGYTLGRRDLAGKQILISAGGTREHLDPVRFLGNPSTGKMGIALAQAALYRSAAVTLVHAPMEPTLLQTVSGIRTLAVTSAEEMRQAILDAFPQADWTVMAAAVADVKPAHQAAEKLPKKDLPPSLPLQPVPDIAAELGRLKKPHQTLIGFAAQTGEIVAPALRKLQQKGLDAIAANPIDQPQSGFGSADNQAVFLHKAGGKLEIPPCSKLEMAHRLFDFILDQGGFQ